jgi:hypothetical protein
MPLNANGGFELICSNPHRTRIASVGQYVRGFTRPLVEAARQKGLVHRAHLPCVNTIGTAPKDA